MSLDYPPDYHNSNRTPTSYYQIYRNIQQLSSHHSHVIVESVISNENYSDHFSDPERNPFAEELLKVCKIEGIRYSFLMNKGRAGGFYDRSKVLDSKFDAASKLCKGYAKKYGVDFSIYDGHKPLDLRLHLNPFGELFFSGTRLGNILDETSTSILAKVGNSLEQLYGSKVRVVPYFEK